MADLWKKADKNAIKSFQCVFDKIWKEEEIPAERRTAAIHPIHLKGLKMDPNNYRGISLLDITYKILSEVLLNRAEPQLNLQIREYQGGFRKGRYAPNNTQAQKHYGIPKIKGKDIPDFFIDLKKNYDSIDRVSLLSILEELGLDRKTSNIIKSILTNTFLRVKFIGKLSDPFGVRQGDGLSNVSYSIVRLRK